MSNNKIDCYFKKRCSQQGTGPPILETSSTVISEASKLSDDQTSIPESSPTKVRKIDQDSNCLNIERDPGLRKLIWDYPIDERDKIRRAYLKVGPYQGIPENSLKCVDRHGRRFLPTSYKRFSDWLEYSPTKNAAYCLPCFLFVKPSAKFGVNAFTSDGFQSWKKVNDGKKCSFLIHEGSTPNSSHNKAVNQCHDLMNSLQHIVRIIDKQTTEQVAKNRLRVKVSIDIVKLCALQVDSSSKRHDQLQIAQAIRIEELTSTNELKTGRGKNQVGTVQRPGDTRWGSHLRSLRSLLDLFDSILLILSEIINDKTGSSPKAASDGAYDLMMSFEFVFILHFMIELLEMTNDLCGILQYKSQDILNAMDAVINTKELIQRERMG
ncbi:hypothetical protein BUALT_Bualt16G0057500 [Buddleja alternifolia]|uniref:TTF-type domain-containing protein n=1 Tax=Buddleja alternifolia TaxID=168488 RepID=A0AAV6WET5_9LAMI|nr:hypothetical protein BUALT_Bualt16G0057500 [Buddleja alternifolia]